jgi:hypothetical protein
MHGTGNVECTLIPAAYADHAGKRIFGGVALRREVVTGNVPSESPIPVNSNSLPSHIAMSGTSTFSGFNNGSSPGGGGGRHSVYDESDDSSDDERSHQFRRKKKKKRSKKKNKNKNKKNRKNTKNRKKTKIKKSKKKSVPPPSNESKPDPRCAPRQIWEDHPSRKRPYEKAKNCHGAGGEPLYHARDTHDSRPHYHPTHKDGTKCYGIHIGYPKLGL